MSSLLCGTKGARGEKHSEDADRHEKGHKEKKRPFSVREFLKRSKKSDKKKIREAKMAESPLADGAVSADIGERPGQTSSAPSTTPQKKKRPASSPNISNKTPRIKGMDEERTSVCSSTEAALDESRNKHTSAAGHKGSDSNDEYDLHRPGPQETTSVKVETGVSTLVIDTSNCGSTVRDATNGTPSPSENATGKGYAKQQASNVTAEQTLVNEADTRNIPKQLSSGVGAEDRKPCSKSVLAEHEVLAGQTSRSCIPDGSSTSDAKRARDASSAESRSRKRKGSPEAYRINMRRDRFLEINRESLKINERSNRVIADLNSQCFDLEKQKSSKEKEVAKLKELVKNLETGNKNLQKELWVLKDEMKEMEWQQNQQALTEKKHEEWQHEIASLWTKNSSLEAEKRQLFGNVAKLQKDLQFQFDLKTAEITQMETELQGARQTFEMTIQADSYKLEVLSQQLHQREEEKKMQQKEILSLRQTVDNLQDKIGCLQQEDNQMVEGNQKKNQQLLIAELDHFKAHSLDMEMKMRQVQNEMSSLRTENDYLKGERGQLLGNVKQLQENQDRSAARLKHEVKRQLEKKYQTQLEVMTAKITKGDKELQRARQTIQEKDIELNEVTMRMCSITAEAVGRNNPRLEDLSTQNRSMKIAEQYKADLYGNDWCDALESLLDTGVSEDEAVRLICNTLIEVFRFCNEHIDRVVGSATTRLLTMTAEGQNTMSYDEQGRDIADIQNKMKDFLRHDANEKKVDSLMKEYNKRARTVLPDERPGLNAHLVSFTRRALWICWCMATQDPPMILDYSAVAGTKFDEKRFKPYCSKGSRVEFLVWPALLLCDGGQLLEKAIVKLTY